MKMLYPAKKNTRVILIGAGEAGRLVAGEILSHPHLGYKVVGFLDDDPKKYGQTIFGKKVLGPIEKISSISKKNNIDEVLITIPSASGGVIRKIVNICEKTDVKFRIIPGVFNILEKRASPDVIRDVEIEDLLKRKPVNFELRNIMSYLLDKKILVTGAGGSIGSELCRNIVNFKPTTLMLLDFSENNLYEIEVELKEEYPKLDIVPLILDIKDVKRVDSMFEIYRPDVVFHAAAYKHVPLMENHPKEAVKNNILGTRNVALSSDKYSVKKFIFISTDKAVNPTSVMGVTKRISEMVVQDIAYHSKTDYIVVRFGNVLGSRGSVIPLFKKQILKGGPVTVTHLDMTRFFMTVSEAVQLIIQAGAIGKSGEIYVLDMGEPVKIINLAEDMIKLFGYEPYKDIPLKIIGTRPGEKIYEEILTEAEGVTATKHRRIFKAKVQRTDHAKLEKCIHSLENTIAGDAMQIKKILNSVVPEYTPYLNNTRDNEFLRKNKRKFK